MPLTPERAQRAIQDPAVQQALRSVEVARWFIFGMGWVVGLISGLLVAMILRSP